MARRTYKCQTNKRLSCLLQLLRVAIEAIGGTLTFCPVLGRWRSSLSRIPLRIQLFLDLFALLDLFHQNLLRHHHDCTHSSSIASLSNGCRINCPPQHRQTSVANDTIDPTAKSLFHVRLFGKMRVLTLSHTCSHHSARMVRRDGGGATVGLSIHHHRRWKGRWWVSFFEFALMIFRTVCVCVCFLRISNQRFAGMIRLESKP